MLPGPNIPFHNLDVWTNRFPWLMAGITHSGYKNEPFDFRIFGKTPSPQATNRWEYLLNATGFRTIAHARQAHSSRVAIHKTLPKGLHIEKSVTDGHATDTPGVLLAVTVADCVPIYLVDPEQRAIALLHAGWRGVAGGIMTEGVQALKIHCNSDVTRLHVHLGPAICGICYEVGPEVCEALGLTKHSKPKPIDLRIILFAEACTLGIQESHITISEHCTLCGTGGFFSHRGGRPERQVALLGMHP